MMHRILCSLLLMCMVPQVTQAISLASVKALFNKKEIQITNDKIGIIKIIGKIELESTEKILKKIIDFTENSNVKGILLVTSSPGGSSAATELLFREIKSLAFIKPIVTLVIIECCSGSYKIAAGTNWIIAPAASIIGSIGTVQVIERHKNQHIKNQSGYEADVEYEVIHGGKYKAVYNPEAPELTHEQRAYLQAETNEIYAIFYTLVAQQRNLSLDRLQEWADGKEFTGQAALKLGLIDQIGGYSDAIKKLKELIAQAGVKLDPKFTFVE
jgi:protease IV